MNTTAKMDKRTLVKQYILNGYSYRHIATKMGFKSTSTVAHYAKDVHQHRLVKVLDSEQWLCNKCGSYFIKLNPKESGGG